MDLAYISVTVEDMDRALAFYRALFQQEPVQVDERLSIFDLGTVRFSLWNATADGADVEFGENCVAAFRVDDLEAERERLQDRAPYIEQIQDQGSYRLFHIEDTEGNLIELFEGEKQ